jgi:nicotinate-nucleotide pyrophosphorylase (carboxylating)
MNTIPQIDPSPLLIRPLVEAALREDVGWGDLSGQLATTEAAAATGALVARAAGVVAGLDLARLAFQMLDPQASWEAIAHDGEPIAAGQVLAQIHGGARALLAGERVALNFVQRLSGIATLTARYAAAVAGTRARIVDTRKTTPGLRALEKYAVRCGGGHNHRFGLSDSVMLKDNHLALIAASGRSLAQVLAEARRALPHTTTITIEIDSLEQLNAALEAGPDSILLDNMPPEQLALAVRRAEGRCLLEASGGISLEKVRRIAESGVDLISVGALTHSAPALDIGLDFIL